MIRLSELHRCFQGVIPSIVVTSDGRGVPNVTYVSQVHFIDEKHVALSCQFFNKTRRNLDENPRAWVEIHDPVTMQTWRLRIRFLRSETSGPLFDSMSIRIQAIASHTGMSGVFKLIAADVFEVDSVEKNEGFLSSVAPDESETVSVDGVRSEIRGLQYVSEKINRARCLEELLDAALESLERYFGFEHTMILLEDDATKRLVTMASRGYGASGVGAEVLPGEGLIGTVARQRRLLRISGLDTELRYGRAVRREHGGASTPEVPLPGLPDAQSALVIPLLAGDRLVGVISAEDRDPMRFGEWDEAYFQVIANQIALGVDRMLERDDDDSGAVVQVSGAKSSGPRHTFTFYKNDDCVFVDGEYLIRNVPGRIFWKLLRDWERDGRTEFSNRELRLDPSIGLPAIKDNLESRLILLRKRLDEKCADVRLVPAGRGKFELRVASTIEMVER